MNVLVTGAGGFVGGGIARALIAREGKARVFRGDLVDRDAVLRASASSAG